MQSNHCQEVGWSPAPGQAVALPTTELPRGADWDLDKHVDLVVACLTPLLAAYY